MPPLSGRPIGLTVPRCSQPQAKRNSDIVLNWPTAHRQSLSMDPISATGLVGIVAQLADFTGVFLLKLYKYYVDVSEAAKCAEQLRTQVGLSLSLLNALHQILPKSFLTLSEYSSLESSLVAVRKLFEEYNEKVNPKSVKGPRLWLWPFQKEELRNLVRSVHEKNVTLQLALNLLQTCPAQFTF